MKVKMTKIELIKGKSKRVYTARNLSKEELKEVDEMFVAVDKEFKKIDSAMEMVNKGMNKLFQRLNNFLVKIISQ